MTTAADVCNSNNYDCEIINPTPEGWILVVRNKYCKCQGTKPFKMRYIYSTQKCELTSMGFSTCVNIDMGNIYQTNIAYAKSLGLSVGTKYIDIHSQQI